METSTSECNLSTWVFRTEGKDHVIMEDKKTGYLYRLMKVPPSKLCAEQDEIEQKRAELQRSLDFVRHVMTPLIGADFLTPSVLVDLPKDFIRTVTKLMPPDSCRTSKYKRHTMDPRCPFASCMKDLCMLPPLDHTADSMPVISVEIKPSWAFLCTSDELHFEKRICRHCMFQVVRAGRPGQWKPTCYCPIDFFSGDQARMRWAMKQMVDSPQSKFKVFKNGQVMFSHDIQNFSEPLCDLFGQKDIPNINERHIDAFLDLVIKALTYVPTHRSTGNTSRRHCNGQCEAAANLASVHCEGSKYKPKKGAAGCKSGLPAGCLLHNILKAQDIGHDSMQSAYDNYMKIERYLGRQPENREQLTLDGPYDHQSWSAVCHDRTEPDEESVEYAAKQCKRFLTAKITKHLSVMVALQRLSDSSPSHLVAEDTIEDDKGQKYRFSAGVIDLDLLPMSTLETEYKKWTKYLAQFCQLESETQGGQYSGTCNGR